MTNTVKHLEKELDKHSKEELSALLTDVGMEPHAKKKVMVNRLRYAIAEGQLTSQFDEGEFDADLEAQSQPKPKKEKVAKAPKEPKPEPVYNWAESKYAGRQVYTSAGTGKITRESDTGHFEVELADGSLKAVNASTTRFKAVQDGYRDKYIKDDTIRTESGSPSIHSGRDISYALLGTTLAELGSVAKENGLTDTYQGYLNRKKPLNPGMIRMNIGNILIARQRKGEQVSIFGLGDMALAAQRGQERGAKEAQAAKDRKAAASKERSEKAIAAKAEKDAAKEKAKAEKQAAAEAKKAEKPVKEAKVKAADVQATKEPKAAKAAKKSKAA